MKCAFTMILLGGSMAVTANGKSDKTTRDASLRQSVTTRGDEGLAGNPVNQDAPLLPRPNAGRGSPRLVDVPVRQTAKIYRTTPQTELPVYLYFPPDWKERDHRTAMIFFFGGGWRNGSPKQFIPQAEYFASQGLVCAVADYRVMKRHGVTPDVCVDDAREAIRWLRKNASVLGINPQRIVVSGGSAGAHIAAAATLIGPPPPPRAQPASGPSVSCQANALVLYNPPLSMVGLERHDSRGKLIGRDLSPLFFIKRGDPPTLLFYGSKDKLRVQGIEFQTESRRWGNRCELVISPGEDHGFFNSEPWLGQTVSKTKDFLKSLGYM